VLIGPDLDPDALAAHFVFADRADSA